MSTLQAATPSGRYHVSVVGHPVERDGEILTPDALDLLRALHRRFGGRRRELLDARFRRDLAEEGIDFHPETAHIREDDTWRVAPPAPGLVVRQVEISGPVDAKTTINALNSGADTWMADLEDATSPTWSNIITGQLNLKDAVAGTLRYTGGTGTEYALGTDLATIVLRPRGLHLLERHLKVDTEPIPASLVDVGLFFFHNAAALLEQGTGPYVNLPKVDNHLEARWWRDVFAFLEEHLSLPTGSIRATVLVETITAAFEMDEILYELRDYAAGLTAGRWDYIFSVLMRLGRNPDFVLPDRADITMDVPFLRAFVQRLIHTCHRRGAYAIGGMTEVIPTDSGDLAAAEEQVRAHKEREVRDGVDGSWVSHPAFVATCREVFRTALHGGTDQLQAHRGGTDITAADLLDVAATPGHVTAHGLVGDVRALVRYLDAWLDGRGATAVDGRMEDTASAEIARCQLWQWAYHGTPLQDGRTVTRELITEVLEEQLTALAADRTDLPDNRIDALRDLVHYGALSDELPPSIIEYAYRTYLLAL